MTKDLQRFIEEEAFGLMMNCAVRYACGRRSYMPSAVISFIKPLLPLLTSRTLRVFDQDITDKKYEGGYGDECDIQDWTRFHSLVKEELSKRGERLYKDWRQEDGADTDSPG